MCRLTTLNKFGAEAGKVPDFIKCDVEGAELFVFKGGQEVIERHKPIIFTEMLRKWSAPFGYHPNEIIELLTDCGYSCFTMDSQKLSKIVEMTDETLETNFFFLHDEKHAILIKTYT